MSILTISFSRGERWAAADPTDELLLGSTTFAKTVYMRAKLGPAAALGEGKWGK